MNQQGKIQILNLAGDLSDSLEEFFLKLDCEMLERSQCEDYRQLDFILIESEFDAINAFKDFKADVNEIEFICLGEVRQVRSFLLNNGRLVIGEELAESSFGNLVLHKFFKKTYDIHLDESYPTIFEEMNDFKLTNHLSAGYYIDQVVLDAFDKDFNIVSLRSFLDHVIFYMAYLKQSGLAGVPFQIEYSSSSDIYAINVHLSVKNFVAEYLIDSFGNVNSRDPLQYLLGVVQRSCDFLEITYIERPGKLVLSGFWTREGKKRVGGIAFNNILMAAQSLRQLERKVRDYQCSETQQEELQQKQENLKDKELPGGILGIVLNPEEEGIFKDDPQKATALVAFVVEKFDEDHPDKNIDDMSDEEFQEIISEYPEAEIEHVLTAKDLASIQDRAQKKNISKAYKEEVQRVRGALEDKDDFKKTLTNTLSEEVAQKVTGKIDVDETINRIMGSKEADGSKQVVKGGKEAADNFMAKLAGLKKDENDFLAKLSSSLGDEGTKSNWNISSGGNSIEQQTRQLVSRAIQTTGANIDPSVKAFLNDSVPKTLNQKLQKFANGLGKKTNELSAQEISEFQQQIPKTLGELISGPAAENFKTSLLNQDEIVVKSSLEPPNSTFLNKIKEKLQNKLTEEEPNKEALKEIMQESVKEVIAEDFAFEKANLEEVAAKEKLLVKSLTEDLDIRPDDAKEIIKDATKKVKDKEMQTVVDNLFDQQTTTNDQKEKAVGDSINESILMEKLQAADQENKNLLKKVNKLTSDLEASQAAFQKIQQSEKEAKLKASEIAKKANEKMNSYNLMSAEEKKEQLEALKKGTLSQEDAHNLADAIEKESEILELAKNADVVVKKLQLELMQKDTKFKSDILRYTKMLKSKDMIVAKAKDSMQYLSDKKEAEKNELAKQVADLNKRLNDDKLGQLKVKVKDLKSINDNLESANKAYREKIEIITQKLNSSQNKDVTKRMQEENRALKNQFNQLENNLTKERKKVNILERKHESSKQLEVKLKINASAALEKLKKYESQIKQLKESQSRLVSKVERGGKSAEAKAAKELEQAKNQLAIMQQKLKDMNNKLKQSENKSVSSNTGGGAREKKLDQDLKKVQVELSKARNNTAEQKKEVVKMKAENTGLKNQIKALKKDLEKAKSGGKGKKRAA